MVIPRMEHGLHVWGMYLAQRFMNPNTNKTKQSCLRWAPTVQLPTLEPGWAACHLSALDIDDRGEKPQSRAAVLCTVPKLHQLPLPFSESYHLLESISGSLEGTERTAWNSSVSNPARQAKVEATTMAPGGAVPVPVAEARWPTPV